MGGAGGNAEPPCQQVPADGGDQPGEDDFQVDKVGMDRTCDGVAYLELPYDVPGYKKGGKVENGCPEYRLKRGKYLCRDDGCYGVGRVVKTVDIIKYQSKDDNNYQKAHTVIKRI